MMTDKMIDEALVEILRAKRALEALRSARKGAEVEEDRKRQWSSDWIIDRHCMCEHAAAKRATLDLTRKLAQLRAGK